MLYRLDKYARLSKELEVFSNLLRSDEALEMASFDPNEYSNAEAREKLLCPPVGFEVRPSIMGRHMRRARLPLQSGLLPNGMQQRRHQGARSSPK